MSIAELIMTGTNRASESTAWVSDSLAKIGQNVGAALAQKEQQKQAQAMLPFLQQSMQESMALAGQGKSGEAYAKLIPLLTDPSVANNPYVLPAIGAASKFIDEESNNFLKKEQLRIQEGMYNQRSDYNSERIRLLEEKQQTGQDTSFQQSYEGAAGIGGPRNVGTPLTPTDRATIEQAAKNIVNLEPLPGETPQQPTGIPAMVTQTTETPTQPFTLESPAAAFTQLGEKPYEPSEQVLQEFQKNVAKYDSASSKEKKQMNSERSIVYDNQDELKNDLPSFNTDQIGFTQVNAGVVDPELVGIKYLRNVEKGRNAQGKITGYEKNKGAAASIERLQTAFNIVNGRQDLRELYANAGGWQNVEIKSVPASKSDIENVSASFEVINKKNREQKVLVTEKDAGFLQSIEMVIPISNTDEMDRIYLKGQQPTAAPALTQGGLPATQPPPAVAPEIPDVEGNPFTEKVKKIKTEETEKQKKLTTDEISRVVETTNRLQQALDGLAKGEYPKVMDYLPRTKKTTLESSSLDALKNEYNVLANLKPAIEWLKKNPNHKDAPAAAEVIKQKLGI